MGIKKKSSKKRSGKRQGLADALFTSTQKRVIALLFGNPERKFFATELIRLAEAGSGAVQRELATLTESGLVNIELQGKQKYYQANRSSPIFEELRRITFKTMGLVEPLKEVLQKIQSHIELALVYGSVAKGTDRAMSDIDLLIVSKDLSLEELYESLGPTEGLIGRKINPMLYTPAEFRKRIQDKNNFLEKVLGGEHLILIGDESAFATTR